MTNPNQMPTNHENEIETFFERLQVARALRDLGLSIHKSAELACDPYEEYQVDWESPEITQALQDFLETGAKEDSVIGMVMAESDATDLSDIIKSETDDIQEELIKAHASRWGLVMRDEGIVPDGIYWELSDGYCGSDFEGLSTDDDPDENTADVESWGEGIWSVSWSLKVVRYDGYSDEVSYDFTVVVDPPEPDCDPNHTHDWQSPYDLLGGCESNPGVWGNGGGVIIKEACPHCGKYKVTNTWAQNSADGTQGHTTVEYEDADEDSWRWSGSLKLENSEWKMSEDGLKGSLRSSDGSLVARWSVDENGDEHRVVRSEYLDEDDIEDLIGWPEA